MFEPYSIHFNNNSLWKNLSLFQGDDWIFTVQLLDYPASNYTLTYQWSRQGVSTFSVVSTPDNLTDIYQFSVPAATTATYTPGTYYVQAFLTDVDAGTKQTLGIQEGIVRANVANIADPRSAWRIAFDAIEAALQAGAGSDVVEYTVGGKTVRKSRLEALKFRAFCLQRVKVEEGRGIGHHYFKL
jgi:hypothetical protein